MAKPREDRSYGGKAGIWLKKRKQKQVVHPSANDFQSKKKVTPPSTNNSDSLIDLKRTDNDESIVTQNPAKRVVVGWDDVRCRPIFRECTGTPSTSSSIHESDDEAVEDIRDEATYCSVENECMAEAASVWVTSTTNSSSIEQSRKTRAYGSRKRTTSNLSSHLDIVDTQQRKRPHVLKKKDIVISADTSIMTPSINRQTFDLATPQTGLVGDGICDALNSETKATPRDPDATNDSIKVLKTTKPTEKEKRGITLLRKSKEKSVKQPALPSLVELDFVDNPVSQPSSTTSLAAAKAFFERLDAQQKLTLDASKTPIVQSKKCVRTRRAIHMTSDSLQKEYQNYATSTKATGVDPLSLEQYAVNRSAFFRTGDMYDGFLDG